MASVPRTSVAAALAVGAASNEASPTANSSAIIPFIGPFFRVIISRLVLPHMATDACHIPGITTSPMRQIFVIRAGRTMLLDQTVASSRFRHAAVPS
jgi:hypothetical protein